MKLTGLITTSSLNPVNFFKSLSSVVKKYSAFPSMADATWSASFDFIPSRVNFDALDTTFLVPKEKGVRSLDLTNELQ